MEKSKVIVCNFTNKRIAINIKHRYDEDSYDNFKTVVLEADERDNLGEVTYWTGVFRTGSDYWTIKFDLLDDVQNAEIIDFECKLRAADAQSRQDIYVKVYIDRIEITKPNTGSCGLSFMLQSGFALTKGQSKRIQYVGRIILFAGTDRIENNWLESWRICNGSYLSIENHPQLFEVIGTTYGGDGQITFQLPDLRGRVPLHQNGTTNDLGKTGGYSFHSISINEYPKHFHKVSALPALANQESPLNNLWGISNKSPSKSSLSKFTQPLGATQQFHQYSISTQTHSGRNNHSNMQPFLTLNYLIAVQGVMPSQA